MAKTTALKASTIVETPVAQPVQTPTEQQGVPTFNFEVLEEEYVRGWEGSLKNTKVPLFVETLHNKLNELGTGKSKALYISKSNMPYHISGIKKSIKKKYPEHHIAIREIKSEPNAEGKQITTGYKFWNLTE